MWEHDKTTTERGYGYEWRLTRLRILNRDMYLCQVCDKQGKTTPATEVDHIIPKAKGGTDNEDNLQSICYRCHKDKSLRDEGRNPRPTYDIKGFPDHWRGEGQG